MSKNGLIDTRTKTTTSATRREKRNWETELAILAAEREAAAQVGRTHEVAQFDREIGEVRERIAAIVRQEEVYEA